MKKLFNNKKLIFTIIGMILVGVISSVWLVSRDDGVVWTGELSDEYMDGFLSEYKEMNDKGEPENVLIVTSDRRPDGYGAIDAVEGPNHTYFLMYDSAEARDAAFLQLKADESLTVEKNARMELMGYRSWGVATMGLDGAREQIGYSGEPVKVAVVDTGLDVDLFREYYPDTELMTYDVENSSDRENEMIDAIGHGTHVIGTVAEGMPKNASIYAIKASKGESKDIYTSDVTTGIYKAANERVDVINLSLGASGYSVAQKIAIDYAKEHNIITVAAAGNESSNEVFYPAGYDSALSISAVNPDLSFADYSNYGETIDFAAPGTYVASINGVGSGTSMAAPHAAAVVATLKSLNKQLSFEDTKNLLAQHARDLGESGKDAQFGYGLLDLNGVEFCEFDGYCDEFGVFTVDAPVYTKMAIDEVTLTPVNYYSISNLMLTEVKLYTDETNYVTKKLQDVHDLTITGYGAETYGLQTVTIACEGVSTTVYVVNPNDYTPGWEYRLDTNDNSKALLTRYYDLRDLDFENESVTKLYVPGQINGKDVVALSETEREVTYGDNDEYSYTVTDAVFSNSAYAKMNLREVYLPESLTVISDYTFSYFNALEKVVMESDAMEVGEDAFSGSRRLRIVEGGIVEMGDRAFAGDDLLEAIELKEGMTVVPSGAFSGCGSLNEIVIPSTVTTIGWHAFYDAKSLERVNLGGTAVRTIDSGAFYGAVNLTEVNLPTGLETIGYNAFRGANLTSLYIPASVTEIRSGAFSENINLATVRVDTNNQVYYDVSGKAVMHEWYSDMELTIGTNSMLIPAETTIIEESAFAGYKTAGVLVIPDSVRLIRGSAFLDCIGLTEIFIPKVGDILDSAFERTVPGNYGDEYVPLEAKLWVYNGNVGYEYATNKGFNYQTIDASYGRVASVFEPRDTLSDETEVELYYDYGVLDNGVFTNHTGTDGIRLIKTVGQLEAVEYSGEVEGFRIGDTYFVATYKDEMDKNATMRIEVTVNGEYPEYTIPTGITGKLWEDLNTVELPEGFSWMESEAQTNLYELGEHIYMAKYTPGDLNTYAPVENVPIVVETVPGRVKLPEPVITVDSKIYDGEWSIDPSLIHVTIEGLNAEDYEVYGSVNWYEVGTTTATIGIGLNYETRKNYGFGDNYEGYYYYTVENYEILPAEVVPELEIDDRTNGMARTEVLEDGIMITAEEACAVIVTYDGGETYTRVLAVSVPDFDNTYRFEFEINSNVEVMVALKGDGDMDGEVSSGDSNLINRSLISNSLRPYRALSDLEKLVFDLDGDDEITSADSNLINRSLISTSLRPYRAIEW